MVDKNKELYTVFFCVVDKTFWLTKVETKKNIYYSFSLYIYIYIILGEIEGDICEETEEEEEELDKVWVELTIFKK